MLHYRDWTTQQTVIKLDNVGCWFSKIAGEEANPLLSAVGKYKFSGKVEVSFCVTKETEAGDAVSEDVKRGFLAAIGDGGVEVSVPDR